MKITKDCETGEVTIVLDPVSGDDTYLLEILNGWESAPWIGKEKQDQFRKCMADYLQAVLEGNHEE